MPDCRKILILDSSPIFRSTLREVILTSHPQTDVTEAENTHQAKSILQKHPVDAVFLDIAFPGNNGIAFITEIKRIVPKARVVVLSSHDSAEYRSASMQNGANYFLSKERSDGLQLLDVIHATIAGESCNREPLSPSEAKR
jgi:DNA-binding NarL/FixJ family response regulator